MGVKVLIADSIDKKCVALLTEAGYEVRVDPAITEASLAQEITDYQVLIVRSKKVNRAAIEAAKALSLIVRAGAGVNTIDVAAAAEKGIFVCNTPGCNNDAVAELAIGHIIACDRDICTNTEHLRKGEWRKKNFLAEEGLKNHTLGIVGRGNIAKSLIKIAHGMSMNVICWSRSLTDDQAKELGVERVADILDVARRSDAISVHVAYNKTETHHLINKAFFDAMKEKAIFVNTARGEIVDTEAMVAAIKEKHIKCGVDVFEGEPAASFGDFAHAEVAQLVKSCTCHIGASTNQAGDVISDETVRVVKTFLQTGVALNCVNIEPKPAADGVLTVRHTGVLPAIIACCAAHGSISSVSNQVLKGEKAQSAVLRIKTAACFKAEIEKIEGVLGVAGACAN